MDDFKHKEEPVKRQEVSPASSPPYCATVPDTGEYVDHSLSAPPYNATAPDSGEQHEAGSAPSGPPLTATVSAAGEPVGSAVILNDGRIEIDFGGRAGHLAESLSLYSHSTTESSGWDCSQPPPKLNIVIQIVGTRGDVQPFISLGHVLQKFGHRVRLATHPVFQKFVEGEGIEFFSISGDPNALMEFMVKNPSLMPGMGAFTKGEISNRRHEIAAILDGCWRSCIEGGDGMAEHPSESDIPFVADVIIANPPSFAHVHIAERLGIPVHLMFTMPWSPTTSFAHPFAKIHPKEKDEAKANRMSYFMVELMTWQGVGDLINRFREHQLGLDTMGPVWASTVFQKLKVPFTYCWSPALIPKPLDWGSNISVAGFYFVDHKGTYSPPPALANFLAAGPPPIYIGFGSIVIDDPKALTEIIFEAVKKIGIRALVSRGSAGLGADMEAPSDVFMLGDCPHSWLFEKVSAVMHHGGAGTTAAGIAAGNPTIVVPFFGDQHFWGKMIARAGGGPEPIEAHDLTVDRLVDAIKFALKPTTRKAAAEFKASIQKEDGATTGAEIFHKMLPQSKMSCDLLSQYPAVWLYKRNKSEIKLSAVAAALLIKEGLIKPNDLTLYRVVEYRTDPGPWDPITGSLSSTMNLLNSMAMGIGNIGLGLVDSVSKLSTQNSTITSEADHDSHSASPSQQAECETPQSSVSAEESHHNDKDHNRAMHGFKTLAVGAARKKVQGSLFVAQGMHNLPRLYGDKMVRPNEKVTGIQSGLKAAGKAPLMGFYDGFSGLVTQPIQGGKEEGALGVLKGAGKGVGGLIVKPVAGVFEMVGYMNQGFWKEAGKKVPKEVKGRIRAGRLGQGAAQLKKLETEDRDFVIKTWKQRPKAEAV